MSRRLLAGALLSVLALAAWNDDVDTRVTLRAEEKVSLDSDVASAPVTFFLMRGDPPQVMFPMEGSELSETRRWQIQIFDGDGKKRSYLQGLGRPRSPWFSWNGLSEAGQPLPDGFYSAQLVWADVFGTHRTAPVSVSLLTPPVLRGLFNLPLQFDFTAEGLVVRLPEPLLFNSGEYALRSEALPALKEVAEFLKSSPGRKVDVRGYTDSVGTPQANLALSRRRAVAVRRFLVDNGVDPNRMTYRGYGAGQPLASNATPEGRAKNRRVEVVVLKGA